MVDLLRSLIGTSLPDWLIVLIAHVITITVIMLAAAFTMMIQVWFERRTIARMQDRIGPNRTGPFGLLQSIADGVKMFTKEDVVPLTADKWVHLFAPVVAVAPVMLMFAVVPWARGVVPSEFGSSVLFVVAVSSISAIGLMMAGWASNNKFALLGALRAVAQLISYEIPAVLALLSVVLMTGTMSLAVLPELQSGVPLLGASILCSDANCSPLLWSDTPSIIRAIPSQSFDLGLGWFVFTPIGLLGFVIFFICVLAEGERTPFDIPEADSEIVAGHTTEYSGMKFALFYLGQFVLNFVLSMITAIVFLGGWQGPGVAALANAGENWSGWAAGLLSLVYMLLKTWALFFVMVWVRGALPRLRIDQLMDFAWKLLLPLTLVNLLSAALWVGLTQWGEPEGFGFIEGMGAIQRQLIALVVTAIINGAAFFWLLQVNRETIDEPELQSPSYERVVH